MKVPQLPFHYERVEIHQINFRGPVAEQQGVGEDSQDHTGRHFEMTITKSEVLYRILQLVPAVSPLVLHTSTCPNFSFSVEQKLSFRFAQS